MDHVNKPNKSHRRETADAATLIMFKMHRYLHQNIQRGLLRRRSRGEQARNQRTGGARRQVNAPRAANKVTEKPSWTTYKNIRTTPGHEAVTDSTKSKARAL